MNWFWPLFAAPFVGSFMGVLIRRLPHGRMLAPARSCCEQCGAALGIRDLVPLASYLALHGRCRSCGSIIAAQHWHVELAAVAVAATAVLAGPAPEWLWPDCAFGWALLTLAWIDWDCMLLPDTITLPLIPAGLFMTLWLDPDLATDHAVAAAIGYTALQAVAYAYKRLRGRDGIGGGDAKMLAAIGAWTGLENLPTVVIGAALAGLAGAGLLALRGRPIGPTTPIPFGCCLALAGWIVLLVT